MSGHDITYLAITGALHAIGRRGEPPAIPLNVVGDFAGGCLYLVTGLLAAVYEANRSGRGQVVDAAIVDGASSLTGLMHGVMAAGLWRDEQGPNVLDSGVPWYDGYESADPKWMAVGPLEPKFHAEFMSLLGLVPDESARRPEPLAAAPRKWRLPSRATQGMNGQPFSREQFPAQRRPEPGRGTRSSPHRGSPHHRRCQRYSSTSPGTALQPDTRTVRITPARPGADARKVLDDWGVPDVDELIASGGAQN